MSIKRLSAKDSRKSRKAATRSWWRTWLTSRSLRITSTRPGLGCLPTTRTALHPLECSASYTGTIMTRLSRISREPTIPQKVKFLYYILIFLFCSCVFFIKELSRTASNYHYYLPTGQLTRILNYLHMGSIILLFFL